MYVDYVYYIGEYGGTLIPENSFKSFERKSESYIRQLTYVRGDIFAQKDDVVKDAVCAVAEVYYSFDKSCSYNGNVKAENNDGYSVTYVTEQMDGQTVEELIRKKAYKAAYIYLLPTGWMNRRVGCDCADQCRHYDLQP